jgi:hypothetical protein
MAHSAHFWNFNTQCKTRGLASLVGRPCPCGVHQRRGVAYRSGDLIGGVHRRSLADRATISLGRSRRYAISNPTSRSRDSFLFLYLSHWCKLSSSSTKKKAQSLKTQHGDYSRSQSRHGSHRERSKHQDH